MRKVCSHYFRNGARYCSDCGAADPDYEAPAVAASILCRYCGEEFDTEERRTLHERECDT